MPVLQLMHPPRLHGSIQHGSSTGRLSMDEPNLQNVPKPIFITFNDSQLPQSQSGVEDEVEDASWLKAQRQEGSMVPLIINIRSAFVAPPG